MGSIPLVALSVKPPAEQDPVGLATKLANLKGLLAAQPQEQQLREQAIQKGALDIKDTQYMTAQREAVNKAWKDAITNDPSTGTPKLDEGKLMNAIGTAGYGSAGQAIAEHLATYHKTVNENKELEQKLAVNQRDSGGAVGYALQKSNYDPHLADALIDQQLNDPNLDPQHKQHYAQAKQMLAQALQQGDDAGRKVVQQIADPMVAQSEKYSKLQTEDITAQARQLSAKTGSERLSAELPGGALAPVNNAELAAYQKSHPGKTAWDFAQAKAALAPTISFNLQAKAGGGLTDVAKDQAAEKYWQTGVLPPAGRGAAALAQNREIMNRAAELHPVGSLAANSAEYAANKDSLKKLQSNFDQVTAFENTAVKNLDLFLAKLKAIPDLGARFANIPLRQITGKMIGDDKVAAMNTARQTAAAEAAKVLNSSNASGVLSDKQFQEAKDILDGNATYASALATVNTFKQDFGNRHQSYSEQIADIKKRMGGGGEENKPAGKTEPVTIKLPSGKSITIGKAE